MRNDYVYFGRLDAGQEFIDPIQPESLVFVKDGLAGRAYQKDNSAWVVFFNDADLVVLPQQV